MDGLRNLKFGEKNANSSFLYHLVNKEKPLKTTIIIFLLMKRGTKILFLFLVVLFLLAIIANSQNNTDADDFFGNNSEMDVIVVLKDDASERVFSNDLQKKAMISNVRNKVFRDLKIKKIKDPPDGNFDFELRNSYATVNGFSGKLKKSSYEKLKNNENVLKIIKPRQMGLLLADSKGISSFVSLQFLSGLINVVCP